MQIDGVREFFSKIALSAGAAAARGNPLRSVFPSLAQRKQPVYDSLVLSDKGKKLSLSGGESFPLIKRQEAAESLPSWAQPIEETLSKTIDILSLIHI